MKIANTNLGNKFLFYTGIILTVLGIAAQIVYMHSSGNGIGKAFYLCGLAFILLGSSATLKAASLIWDWEKKGGLIFVGIILFLISIFLAFVLCIFGDSNVLWVDIICPLFMGVGDGLMSIGFESFNKKKDS